MRRLNRRVLSGGVFYPAGQESTPELEVAVSDPTYWDDDADPAAPEPAPTVEVKDYEKWHVPQLEAEVEKRNADRDPDGDAYIVVGGKGNKPDLITALQADDAGNG